MSQGLAASGYCFNRLTAEIIRSSKLFNCLGYVDDPLLHAPTAAEILRDLEALLKRLQYYRLRMKPQKCAWLKRSVKFLGLKVDGLHIYPDEKKCELISKLNSPNSARSLKSFIALLSWFRKFIKGFSDKVAIFSSLLKKGAEFIWLPAHEARLQELKNYLRTTSVMLAHPDWHYPFKLVCDASQTACGYCLMQETPEGDRVILYGSRLWSDSEKRLHANECEIACCAHACVRLSRYLQFRKFKLVTDSMTATYVKSLKKTTGRLFRLGNILSSFNFEISHVKGSLNPVDILSRTNVPGDESEPEADDVKMEGETIMSIEDDRQNHPQVLAINRRNMTAGIYSAD